MTSRNAKDIFLEAIEVPESARTEFVHRECEGSSDLLQEVTELVRCHAEAGEFLDESWPTPWVDLDSLVESSPESIGGRKVIKKLGQGGFGVVYLAQQEEPIRAQVAVKVIRPGMASGEVVARFAAERRALERMKHPNIASVLDAGTTEEGLPYFVLEFVSGEPISDYFDRHRPSLRERCRLIIEICSAVQHAHEKGVIHRDIKPSNVLVTEIDGRPIPKVIDFGLAKAVRGNLADTSALTLANQIVGTPQYMSPEQVTFGDQDIDTRTDVYSLGALTYTLLSGFVPFAEGRLRNVSPLMLEKVIREEFPAKPSVRVRSEGTSGGPDHRLARQLKGDLDWVITKAMEKDRERRYSTAAALASDLQRYLDGKAVEAGPPSRIYRLRKLIGRNRVVFLSLLIVAAALIATTVFSVVAARDERRERREAEKQLSKYESIAGFTEQMLAGLDPAISRGADTALLQKMLQQAAGNLDDDPPEEPEVEIQLRTMIGQAYQAIALDARAAEEHEKAVGLAGKVLPEFHPMRLKAEAAFGQVLNSQSRFDPALAIFEKIYRHRSETLGDDDPLTLEARSNFAVVLQAMGRLEDAHDHQKAVFDRRTVVLGAAHQDTVAARNNLATTLSSLNRHSEAASHLEEVLKEQILSIGQTHPRAMATMNNLALSYSSAQRHDDATKILERLLEAKKRVFSPRHPSLVIGMNNLATVYGENGKPREAVRVLREALEIARSEDGRPNLRSLTLQNNLGVNLIRDGREAEALSAFEGAASGLESLVGLGHPNCITAWSQVASMKQKSGAFQKALDLTDKLLEATVADQRAHQRALPQIHRTRARCLVGLNRAAEAEAPFLQAFSLAEGAFAGDVKRLRSFAESVRDFYRDSSNTAEQRRWDKKLSGLEAGRE